MAQTDLEGAIIVLTLFDVADEINLPELRPLIGGTTIARAFKDPAPEYLRFERPPVVEPLPSVTLPSGEKFEATLQYYDYGVVSLLLRFTFRGDWPQLLELSSKWVASTLFDELSRNLVKPKVAQVRSALVKPYNNWLSEDYYVFCLQNIQGITTAASLLQQRGAEISQIVRGESAQLAESERAEVLEGHMSYYPNDLLVAGWNAAFVYDTD